MAYVLDTSIILAVGKNIFHEFEGQEVVLPLIVIRELEGKRNDLELGLPARNALRFLEELRTKGDIRRGVELDNGTSVRIEINHIDSSEIPAALIDKKSNDHRILSVAMALDATLITRDLPLRIMAGVVGIEARDHTSTSRDITDLDIVPDIYVSGEQMSALYSDKMIQLESDLPINTYAVAETFDSNGGSALVRVGKGWNLHLVSEQTPCGVSGRSSEQRFALDALLNPEIKIVSLGGRAGTGKTMLSLAAGAQQVRNKEYSKIIVFRNMWAVGGQDLGFLPGTEEEKMSPWTAAIWDAMKSFLPDSEIAALQKQQKIEVLPLTHIRGRTLQNSLILIDEAQNLEANTLLTALSRAGNGSKVILSFDVDQRDNPYISKHSGVLEVASRLRGEKLFAHVTLVKSERSDIAELTTRLLVD